MLVLRATLIEVLAFGFKVDDGADDDETSMRNGGDRGKSVCI